MPMRARYFSPLVPFKALYMIDACREMKGGDLVML